MSCYDELIEEANQHRHHGVCFVACDMPVAGGRCASSHSPWDQMTITLAPRIQCLLAQDISRRLRDAVEGEGGV